MESGDLRRSEGNASRGERKAWVGQRCLGIWGSRIVENGHLLTAVSV
jgi:hypothetical protein